ncbi:MAG: RNA polymerase sigma-70 factor [Chitinophagaceae bacterium]|nr:MAG: RNA polymerase sigma-70 factor [Chitinophagaceae bacterium]
MTEMNGRYFNIDNKFTDRDAGSYFTKLFHQFEKPLFRFMFKITKCPQQSSDLVQDVFSKLWEHNESFDSIRDMEAWLHRCARNRVIDYIRKTAADQRLRDKLWARLSDAALSPGEITESREYERIMAEAILSLPEKRRAVYQLKREDGLNYQEISERLSISPHTVKNQMTTALRSIHRFVKGSLGIIAFLLFR